MLDRTAWILAVVLLCHTAHSAPRFEKLSEHFYHYQTNEASVGAVVTGDGVLLINPPADPQLKAILAALRKVTSKPVQWVVATDYRIGRDGDVTHWLDEGALVLGSTDFWKLYSAASGTVATPTPKDEAPHPEKMIWARVAFEHQVRLFPGGIEVRIFALDHKAHTGGDLVIFVPAEKVLALGDLYTAGSYPEIDAGAGDGNASGWIDGMKQVIDAVPRLRPAIPSRTDAAKSPQVDKTLEETFTVVSARGPRSNLQEMRNMLEMAQKLRADLGKAVSSGINRETAQNLPSLAPYRGYSNFDAFALQLFDSLSSK